MTALATAPLGVLLLCLAAAVLGSVGAWRHARRGRIGRVMLQWPLALLLLLALVSATPRQEQRLLVLGAGATAASALERGAGHAVVALPGGPVAAHIEPVPDLATALRRHSAAQHVVVLGRGLAEHDRAALGARTLEYVATPLAEKTTDFVELTPPAVVPPGLGWTVRGRLRGDVDSIELLDPSGTKVAAGVPDGEGRFVLGSVSRAPGAVLYTLRILRGEAAVATFPLPVAARAGATPRVLLYGGVPTPDTKYLRRWALDAGIELESRVALAPTLTQRRGEARLDAATLAELDLLIVDERSWPQLAPHQALLREAVGAGLGLLVRITGPVPERVARDWRELGIDLQLERDVPRAVNLVAGETPLHAWPVTWRGAGAPPPPAWRDATGSALAAVLPQGQGRIGVLWLADSFRLRTRGTPERHATLWASLVGAVARARAAANPSAPERLVRGQRAVLCSLPAGTVLLEPDGGSTQPVMQDGCAAWWPREAGWHRIATGAGQELGDAYVHQPADVATLLDQFDRDATTALADGTATTLERPAAAIPPAGRWLMAWLLLMTLAWWLERRARQASSAPTASLHGELLQHQSRNGWR